MEILDKPKLYTPLNKTKTCAELHREYYQKKKLEKMLNDISNIKQIESNFEKKNEEAKRIKENPISKKICPVCGIINCPFFAEFL